MNKRIIAMLALVALILVLAACGTGGEGGTTDSPEASAEKISLEGADISLLIGSHSSWPYDENFKFWQYFREATGANLAVTAIPNTDFVTKLSLLMASPEELPDLIYTDKGTSDGYAQQGAFVAIEDYADIMPNYNAFWNTFPEEERKAFLTQRLGFDGKTYFPQVYGYEKVMNLRAWMYRKDIFEKNNLKTPDTMDELYDVSMKLKEIYPDSYPLCFRSGLAQIDVIGPEFKPYFSKSLYYDYDNEKWGYGATEPTMKEITEYLIKLRKAGILPPDYLTITSKAWEELMSTDRGFMTAEYMVRFDFFNLPNRERDPDYTWAIMTPPRGMSEYGQNIMAKYNVDPSGYAIVNTGDEQRIKTAITLVDWMYSDEATDLLSWGKEGETYTVVDGKRKFIVGEGESPTAKYGVLSYGLYLRLDPTAVTAAYSDEQTAMTEFAIAHNQTYINPTRWLALDASETASITDLNATLTTFVEENLSKFLLEQRPMSEWDSFQAEIKEIGSEELVEVYAGAFDRVMNKD